MRPFSRWLGISMLALAFIVPTFGQETKPPTPPEGKEGKKDDEPKKKDDDKKKDSKKNDDKKAKEDPPEKLAFSGKFAGKVTAFDEANGADFTFHISYKVAEPNQDAQRRIVQNQQRVNQLQFDLQRAKNAQEVRDRQRDIMNAMNEIAKAQADLVRYKDVTKDFKLRLADNAKIRTAFPPLDYDDKGNVKKYTAEDLKTLRGTGGLPGYTAERDALRVGQLVEVYLAVPKGSAPPATGKGATKKKGNEDELLNNPERPEVIMIVVVQEPMVK